MTCKWDGRDQPRVIVDRHAEDCRRETCAGCLPCSEPHCRVCGITHAEGGCPECLAETRDNLRGIGRLCDALPEEVEHRGINGEAMVLLGPSCDPEARGHLEASVLAGRVPADYLDVADDERHPLFVLGTWLMVWQDALEHDDAAEVTVPHALDYLDRQLTYMAGYPHVPFEDFARDVRQCREHLEAVLHDGEQVDKGAPCMKCRVPLERTWGADHQTDGWRCPRCKQSSTEAQYRFAVMQAHRQEAAWLTDGEMFERTGIKATTVRSWARTDDGIGVLVRKRRDSGRTVYAVADVLTVALDKDIPTRGLDKDLTQAVSP